MGVREKLLTKQRPRTTLRVQTSEISQEELQALRETSASLLPLMDAENVEEAALAAARAAQRAAEEATSEHFVDIELQAATPTELEMVIAQHPSTEQTRPGQPFADGGMDWRAALPVLLALCALDEDLQDAQWWKEYLEQPLFSDGELVAMWRTVLLLNMRQPAPRLPKG